MLEAVTNLLKYRLDGWLDVNFQVAPLVDRRCARMLCCDVIALGVNLPTQPAWLEMPLPTASLCRVAVGGDDSKR